MKSEFQANIELAKMCKERGYASYAFNLSGDVARQALANSRLKRTGGLFSTFINLFKGMFK